MSNSPMHRYILAMAVIALATITTTAQVTPNTQTLPNVAGQTLNPIPSSYSSGITLNCVRSWEAERPMTADSMIAASLRTVYEVKQTTLYLDGLGRPLQTVVKGISPKGFDFVTPLVYDSFGREAYTYLPYTDTGNAGNFKMNPFAQQNAFMTSLYNPTGATNGEKFFYERHVYEASSLDRVLSDYPAGNSWAGNATGSVTQYQTSTLSDSLIVWRIGYSTGLTPTSGGYYAYGQLLKKVTTDEAGHQVVEYTSKDGHLILRKVQIGATIPSTAYTGWFCTYYVYDYTGNLRCVIQPKAVDWLRSNAWTFDATTTAGSTIAQELCFTYEYDQRNRIVIKRVPGAGETWMVYDARDRLVLGQDSVLRSKGQWLYTQYDSLNRQVSTGLWTSSNTRLVQKSYADTSISWPVLTAGSYTVLTKNHYDDYSWVSASGSGLNSAMIASYTSNTNYFYAASDVSFPYPRSVTPTAVSRGLITGTEMNILGSNSYLYAVDFYDDRGRVIQVHSTNCSGGKDTTTTQYGFNGQVLRVLQNHGKAGVNTLAFSALTKKYYTATGSLASVIKKIGNSAEDTVAANSYDELGRLSLKMLGRRRTGLTNYAYTANPLDTLRYTYNVRSWVQGINKDYCNNANGANNWFGMELSYDYGFSATQLNGNLAGAKWKNRGDGQRRAYGFSYDPVNRLIQADFRQDSSGSWLTNKMDFSLRGLTYDANGNLLTLNQLGLKLNTTDVVDSLLYGYASNSNKLLYVTDRKNDTTSLLGDFKEFNTGAAQDYSYDGNGNMTADNNKGIANIHYNVLNLADSISLPAKGYIKYKYDASGTRQQKITVDNLSGKQVVTTYLGPFVYQYAAPASGSGSDTLQFITQEEGRIRLKSVNKTDTVQYDFFEKDHLGNTRVVLTDELQQDTYPAATLENNSAAMAVEQTYYTISLSDTISTSRIASWNNTSGNGYVNNNGNPPYNTNPSAATSSVSSIVYKLNGATGDKTGLGITLKVMAGDTVAIYGKSFWHNGTGSNPSNTYLINAALNSFIAAFAGTSVVSGAVKGATASALQGAGQTTGALSNWLTTGVPNPGSAAVPRAYINWILFNNQFVPVAANSGFDLVNTSADAVKNHSAAVPVGTSGYLYVYCSNESNLDVFFDNLQVVHTRGPLLETTDYYPGGLAMAGISDKALKTQYAENRFKFNGKELQNREFSDGFGLEMYDFGARMQDPQLATWHSIDPMADENRRWSPYAYAMDNPVRYIDPDGRWSTDSKGNISTVDGGEIKAFIQQLQASASSSSEGQSGDSESKGGNSGNDDGQQNQSAQSPSGGPDGNGTIAPNGNDGDDKGKKKKEATKDARSADKKENQEEKPKTKAQEVSDKTSVYGAIVSGMATTVDAARKYGVGLAKGAEVGGKIASKVITHIGVAGIAVTWINVGMGNESVGRGVVQTGIGALGFIPNVYTITSSIVLTVVDVFWGDKIEDKIRGK